MPLSPPFLCSNEVGILLSAEVFWKGSNGALEKMMESMNHFILNHPRTTSLRVAIFETCCNQRGARKTTCLAIPTPKKKHDNKMKLLEVVEDNKSFPTVYRKLNLGTCSRSCVTS